MGFVPLKMCIYTLLYDSDDSEFTSQWALSSYHVASYNVSLMWRNSGNNATECCKADVLPLPNTIGRLDQNLVFNGKINEIYLLGHPSWKTGKNRTHANLLILTQIYREHLRFMIIQYMEDMKSLPQK